MTLKDSETQSTHLTSGPPPRSYGAVPPEHGAPSDGPSHSLPLHAPPPEPISHDRDELLHKQRQTLINCIYLAILLIQAVVIICGSDALAKFIDLDSAANCASKERFALIAERDKLRREIQRWEKVKEDRVPQDTFWDGVWPALDCSAYGKREYWGVLRNIPDDWSPIEACMSMPVEIMGVAIRRPHRCAFIDGSPHIHGYWTVDWDQPDCQPWYREYQDVGCTSYMSGKRRIEAELVGINDRGGQDWWLFCRSTPLIWKQITYTSPTHCQERSGTKFAMWDTPDDSCL